MSDFISLHILKYWTWIALAYLIFLKKNKNDTYICNIIKIYFYFMILGWNYKLKPQIFKYKLICNHLLLWFHWTNAFFLLFFFITLWFYNCQENELILSSFSFFVQKNTSWKNLSLSQLVVLYISVVLTKMLSRLEETQYILKKIIRMSNDIDYASFAMRYSI